jgi:hypothetical protein
MVSPIAYGLFIEETGKGIPEELFAIGWDV